jgi:hypothetical protein
MPHYSASKLGHFSGSSGEDHRRHILDKEILARCFKIASIELSDRELASLKRVVNDLDVNCHAYKSKGANVGVSDDYAEENECNRRRISDKSAVQKVVQSFLKDERVDLTSHESAHISAQMDVFLHDDFKDALSPEKYQKTLAAYVLLTDKVYGPKDSKTYTDGKIVDGRKVRWAIPDRVKSQVDLSAHKYRLTRLILGEIPGTKKTDASKAKERGDDEPRRDGKVGSTPSGNSSSSKSRSESAADSNINDVAHLLGSMSISPYGGFSPLHSSGFTPYGFSHFPMAAFEGHSHFHSSSRSDFPSYSVRPSSPSGSVASSMGGTRGGSSWDHFRSNVWTGGSRAEMSAAYKEWKN